MIPHVRIPGSQNSRNRKEEKTHSRANQQEPEEARPAAHTASEVSSHQLSRGLSPYCTFWPISKRQFFTPLISCALPHLPPVSPLHRRHPSALSCQEEASCAQKPNEVLGSLLQLTPQTGLDLRHNFLFITSVCHCLVMIYVMSPCV